MATPRAIYIYNYLDSNMIFVTKLKVIFYIFDDLLKNTKKIMVGSSWLSSKAQPPNAGPNISARERPQDATVRVYSSNGDSLCISTDHPLPSDMAWASPCAER